ncbi:MAG: type ISP restriction/modification enzyme [Thermodesulfobacteriota bacterium]
MLKEYFTRLHEIAGQGDAREESYYPALEQLLTRFTETRRKPSVHITTLPKRTEAGNPDFRVWDGHQHIIGYIEAKEPGNEYLDQVETSEQLRRYIHTFPNLILTNFFEFRLYRNGSLIDKVLLGRPFWINKIKRIPPVENEEAFYSLLEKYYSFSLPKVYEAKTLAVELAKRTRFLKDWVITEELKKEKAQKKGFISGFYLAFREYLIHGLSPDDFADLYSQTITYGLFAARTRMDSFNRKLAYDGIPPTIGILRDVFHFISLGNLPKQMEWIIDDLAEVLAVTNVQSILHGYFHNGRGKDPVVHFYETFLAEYDPKTRERRGVYYTPEPVVSFIVHSVHQILKESYGKKDGLADEQVTVLDPAAGTLTFLAEAASLAVSEFVGKFGQGGKETFIRDHILKNFFAFELMMAPYAVGHLKMSFLLEELGYRLKDKDRFKLYLTNTLEMEDLAQTEIPGMSSLSEESHLAGKVKKKQPILVIIGNPPYSGHSTNIGEWITEEIMAYHRIDGKPLGEKNPKWLKDDYVKFIRFAQWKIDQAGEGVIGLITNHSYLDNPTFRGMRRSLMESFDEIYILDLHGNSLKKEKCPDGSKDENVFDIKQGVSIALFLKKKGKKKDCRVFHSELWGKREEKYARLEKENRKTLPWQEIKPKAGFYLFVPRDESRLEQYERYPKITDIFPVHSVGIVTARDSLTIRWTPNEVWTTVMNFSKSDPEMARTAYRLGKDARDWKVELAQKDLRENGLDRNKIVPIFYRPFDIRFTYYTGRSRGFHCMPRSEVMQHMLEENLGLVSVRQVAEGVFNHALITNNIIESRITLSNKGIAFLFPLFVYPPSETKIKNPQKKSFGNLMLLFEPHEVYKTKKANIAPAFLDQLTKVYRKSPSPEQILHYIYAVLYSKKYRTRYAEFLKMDFPRVPFTSDRSLFLKAAHYGERLVDLHLLRGPGIDPPLSRFQGQGETKVEKPNYDKKNRRVYINSSCFFEEVSGEVWDYMIGGYRVCDKWLKDRKGRILELEEIKQYCQIITALYKTIGIQKDIDQLFDKLEKKTT